MEKNMKTKPKTTYEYKNYEILLHEDGTWHTKNLKTNEEVSFLSHLGSAEEAMDMIDEDEQLEEIQNDNGISW
jgi:hypothetical protein